MTLPIGQLVANRYEVLAPLASAAQGDVYRVRDTYEEAICVLKLLNVATLTAGPWDEAQILRDLADDHILEIRNADLYAGQPYIVTALAEHGTLESELVATNGLGLDVDHVVSWMRQASMGVARAHDRSLVHNDIKPANLFLTASKECLVGDFGLASRVPPLPMVGVARGATAETALQRCERVGQLAHPQPRSRPMSIASVRPLTGFSLLSRRSTLRVSTAHPPAWRWQPLRRQRACATLHRTFPPRSPRSSSARWRRTQRTAIRRSPSSRPPSDRVQQSRDVGGGRISIPATLDAGWANLPARAPTSSVSSRVRPGSGAP